MSLPAVLAAVVCPAVLSRPYPQAPPLLGSASLPKQRAPVCLTLLCTQCSAVGRRFEPGAGTCDGAPFAQGQCASYMRQQCATPSGEPGLHNASLQSSAMMYGLNKGCKLALDSNGDPVDLDQARPRCVSFVFVCVSSRCQQKKRSGLEGVRPVSISSVRNSMR